MDVNPSRQTQLPFSREGRLNLIRSCEFPSDLGSTPTVRRVRSLLHHLEMHTGRDGCFPKVSTLAYLMGCDERTVKRLVARLREFGILVTERKVVYGCGRENRYFIQWDRLAVLGASGDRNPVEGTDLAPISVPYPPELSPQTDWRKEEEVFLASKSQEETSSSPALAGTKTQEVSPTAWREIEEEVRAFGVDCFESAVAAAVTAGCSPVQIRAAIAYAGQDHGWRVPAGALRKKLLAMRPGDEVRRHFPASAGAAKDEAKERRKAEEFTRQRREAIAGQVIREARRKSGRDDRAIYEALMAANLPEHAARFAGVPK